MVGTLGDVGTLEQIEVLERLDFEPKCEACKVTDQDVAAKWVARPTCCSRPHLYCDKHRAMLERVYWLMIHTACGRVPKGVVWTPLGSES